MSEEGVIWLRAIFSCVMPLWGRYFFMNDRRDGGAHPYGRFAMWYVLQTTTGQEEKLVQMIQELVAPELYEDCFVAYYERVWRKQQQSVVHVERLFPGYVFVVTQNPEELFFQLKKVPAMSKLVAADRYEFLPIKKEEETFFYDIFDLEHVVRLSYVETDDQGQMKKIHGPVGKYANRVRKCCFKKRYLIMDIPMGGVEKTVALGIKLKEDL